jgi:hypothetical protein
LEERYLLSSLEGGQWTYGSRITYSFMPDGTCIGGVPSSLTQTMNAGYGTTAAWQQAFVTAAAIWEQVTNINLVQVSDNGEPDGAPGLQQGDPNVGDIRIGALPMGSGQLAFTLVPPPVNGGTDAGDMFFNSTQSWGSKGYDLETVALHEFGHALGLGESSVMQAVMYTYYTGVKTTLNADDIGAIQSLYGKPPTSVSNSSISTATNVNSYFNSSGSAAIPNLNIASSSMNEFFSFMVPSNTTGTVTITMQVTGLSELSPRLAVFNSSGQGIGQTILPNTLGSANATYTLTNVSPGQVYYIRASAANAGPGSAGAYGLVIAAGTTQPAPLAPPHTAVVSQPDLGGGTQNMLTKGLKGPQGSSDSSTTLTLDPHHHGHKVSHNEGHPATTKVTTLKRVKGELTVRVVPQGPLQAFKTVH